MARRGKGRRNRVDGLLLLDKPYGVSSNGALQQVKRLFNAEKAGHTGSLDPAATGMLPLCFGEATKVCAFLLDADKTYRVEARLGSSTDSGDATGQETVTAAVPALSTDEWDQVLQSFVGDSEQVPPMYSALKKDGKRLYELARKGETVERKPRPIHIDSISLLEIHGDRLVFRVSCSKGTYVRTLVEDVATAAGTVAHTRNLHRERVADFETAGMHPMGALESTSSLDDLKALLLPADRALSGFAQTQLSSEDAERFCIGQAVSAPSGRDDGLLRVYRDDQTFLGIGELQNGGLLAPKRVFRTA